MLNINNNKSKEEKAKKKLKIIYSAGLIAFCFLFILILTNSKNIEPMFNKINFIHQNNKTNSPYLEDNSDSDNKINVEKDEEKQKENISEINSLPYKINSEKKNTNPNILKINGQYFYLYDEDILLPLDTKLWDEYNIEGDINGKYDKITDFYTSGEGINNWTQKLSIHKLNVSEKDCFEFTDKLVNGIIISITNQLDVKNIKLDENNLSFNYIQKDTLNTLMYWEKKDISNVPDETQFVRVFVAPYSSNMYLITYTLKTNLNSISDENITNSFKTLNSIQELKKKGN